MIVFVKRYVWIAFVIFCQEEIQCDFVGESAPSRFFSGTFSEISGNSFDRIGFSFFVLGFLQSLLEIFVALRRHS